MNVSEAKNYIGECNGTVIKLGTERICELLELMGRPQDSLNIIQVTGTNGKGSFCTLLSNVLTAAGFVTGKFSSPSIMSINDTIWVDERPITDYDFMLCAEYVKSCADKCKETPTGFELETALALEYFRRRSCNYVILEVGMGGRLDATNAVERNILSVITSVSIDHTKFLGTTIAEIAREKAGIIKHNSPVLFGGENVEAEAVIEKAALENGGSFKKADYSEIFDKSFSLESGTYFSTKRYKQLHINLLGEFQVKNAYLVLKAIDILRAREIEIPDIAVYTGFERAVQKGRFELIGKNPIFISDGAHNINGITAAVESIKLYFGEKKLNVITGVMSDKDYVGIAKLTAPIAERIFTVTPPNPRALDAEKFADIFRSIGADAKACNDIKSAVSEALELGEPVISLGSLYMYNNIEKAFKKQ